MGVMMSVEADDRAERQAYRRGARAILDEIEDWHLGLTSAEHKANCACCAANRELRRLLRDAIERGEWPKEAQDES